MNFILKTALRPEKIHFLLPPEIQFLFFRRTVALATCGALAFVCWVLPRMCANALLNEAYGNRSAPLLPPLVKGKKKA